MDMQNLILVAIAFALGGVLKGATGAGAPVLAVPLLAMLFDVRFAVAVFVLPNIVTNIWQAWQYRKADIPRSFVVKLAVAGGLGTAIGTYVLAVVSSQTLIAGVAAILVVYILFRLFKPAWHLSFATANQVIVPVGTVAGILQGATGLSAPVSITFLSAIDFDRPQFIFSISTFFFALGLVQLPFLMAMGIMTWERFGLSALSLIPLLAAMPVGMIIGRHLSRKAFDSLLLCLLAALAARMLYSVVVAA